MKVKNQFLVATALLMGFASLQARADGSDDHMRDLEQRIEEAVRTPTIYSGFKSGSIDDGDGSFCKKERTYSLFWQAQVGDVNVDINDNGIATISVGFKHSKLSASGFRKGGVLCTWMGGDGELGIDDIAISVAIDPKAPQNGNVRYKILALALNNIQLNNITASVPFWSIQNGEVPDWLMESLEYRLNTWLVPFILHNFQPQIDHMIENGLAKLIDHVKKDGFQ